MERGLDKGRPDNSLGDGPPPSEPRYNPYTVDDFHVSGSPLCV